MKTLIPGLRRTLLTILAVAGLTHAARADSPSAAVEGYANNFAPGSAGYQPLISITTPYNLLAAPGTLIGVSGGAPEFPLDGTGAVSSWSKLTDNSYGVVPQPGGGATGALQIYSGYTITYYLASPRAIGYIDIYSGWGDNGRVQHDYTVSYATAASPDSFIPLQTVAWHPATNSARVRLTVSGLTGVSRLRFEFGRQQNAMVGFAELVAVVPSSVFPPPGAFTRSDFFDAFQIGFPVFPFDVPPAGRNLFAAPGTVLTLSPGTPDNPPDGGGGTSPNWSTLTNGSCGLAPPFNGGGPGEVAVSSGWTLTYTLPALTNVASIFIFSGWGDPGRMQQDLTVSYTTADSGYTFITLPAIAYHPPAGNCARVRYDFNPPLSLVTSIRFAFGNQQNGYVGYTELSAVAPRPDTDHDLLPDDWEMEKAGNLTDLTGLLSGPGPGAATGDFDGDGLADGEEFYYSNAYPGLNPKSADSDGDGLKDGLEIAANSPGRRTDPTNTDTDGDGLPDGVETGTGIFAGPSNTGTSPNAPDSDGDQYPDGYEVQYGSDPNFSSSRPTTLPAGIQLGVVTDEASTGISTARTFTHRISGGGAATVNGVVLDALTDTSAPANFSWVAPDGKSVAPPVTNGDWNPAAGNVTGQGNLNLFGSFTYSGAGTVGSSQEFNLDGLQPGLTYELRLFIRKWNNSTVRPAMLKFTNRLSSTIFYLLEDRPAIVLGNSNNDSAYYVCFTYVAASTSLSITATVPNVTSASGSFHLYGLTNWVSSTALPFSIASLVRAPNGSSATLTINSSPGRVYAVDYSTNLFIWMHLTFELPATGTATEYVDTVASSLPRVYYRARDVTDEPH